MTDSRAIPGPVHPVFFSGRGNLKLFYFILFTLVTESNGNGQALERVDKATRIFQFRAMQNSHILLHGYSTGEIHTMNKVDFKTSSFDLVLRITEVHLLELQRFDWYSHFFGFDFWLSLVSLFDC